MTETALLLAHEIDETLAAITGIATKAQRDPFHDHEAEINLRAQLADAWDKRLPGAYTAAHNIIRMAPVGPGMIEPIIDAMRTHLAGRALTSLIHPRAAIGAAFEKGKAMVMHQAKKKSVSRFRKAKNDFFGLLFGMTESHATQALYDQLMLSAGGFFDDQMTEIIRNQLKEWFDGEISKDELIKNLRVFTNTRLASNGAESQPKSYFEGLAEHYIVRARNFGSIYQADNIGVTKYKIDGILDHRTSTICRPLIESGRVFELAGAKEKMNEVLKIRDLSQLKSQFPFLTSPHNAQDPIPPLHWRCRSWMEYII